MTKVTGTAKAQLGALTGKAAKSESAHAAPAPKAPKLTGTVSKIFLFAQVRPHTASGGDIFINEVVIPEPGTRLSFNLIEDENGQEVAINVELVPGGKEP
jgi:hypothetical protein